MYQGGWGILESPRKLHCRAEIQGCSPFYFPDIARKAGEFHMDKQMVQSHPGLRRRPSVIIAPC
jgi:hypothetical protein